MTGSTLRFPLALPPDLRVVALYLLILLSGLDHLAKVDGSHVQQAAAYSVGRGIGLVIKRLRNLGSTPDAVARRCVLVKDT